MKDEGRRMKDEGVRPCSGHKAFILHPSCFILAFEGILGAVVTLVREDQADAGAARLVEWNGSNAGRSASSVIPLPPSSTRTIVPSVAVPMESTISSAGLPTRGTSVRAPRRRSFQLKGGRESES